MIITHCGEIDDQKPPFTEIQTVQTLWHVGGDFRVVKSPRKFRSWSTGVMEYWSVERNTSIL